MFGTIFNETKLGERIKFDDKKGSIFVHGVSANLKNMLSLYTYEKENHPIIYILKDDFEMIYYIQLKKQGKKETTENE